ncbi:hypothetical protein QYB28_002958 [Clostridium perfringens]|uniref:rolling circle replication-associated protein n=1 Tax=Clostridium perfringens TaxID=1502 RepID=UPI00155DB561|nr:hypothetical protein [Clostridium perfringens]MBI6033725.1 hypothetical protein [Clostridium perfringens]UUR88564.1 hypothetical protein NQ194_16475 [Clostridium perfringens]
MAWREKRIYSGDMLEIEIYPISIQEKNKSRSRKKRESSLGQRNLNEKNSKKNIVRLINTNFTEKDLGVTLTYKENELPESLEEAKKDVSNFIRRVKRYLKKNKLPDLKYISVVEYKEKRKNNKAVRIHHHLIMSGDIGRDKLESLWNKGRCNTYRLQSDDFGFEGIAKYMLKDPKGNRRYSASRNLKKPVIKINDSKYSRRKVYNLATGQGEDFEEMFKEYKLSDFKHVVNDELGAVFINVKMKRRE